MISVLIRSLPGVLELLLVWDGAWDSVDILTALQVFLHNDTGSNVAPEGELPGSLSRMPSAMYQPRILDLANDKTKILAVSGALLVVCFGLWAILAHCLTVCDRLLVLNSRRFYLERPGQLARCSASSAPFAQFLCSLALSPSCSPSPSIA